MQYLRLVQTKDELKDPKLDSPAVYFAEKDNQLAYFKVKYNAVDLGLSVKWSNVNINANDKDGYGQYFAWADTEGFYEEEITASSRPSMFTDTWYSGRTASKATEVSGETDAAYVIMGEKWRTPTYEECYNMFNGTDKTIETINGIEGIRFTNKKDSEKSIFVPLAGIAAFGMVGDKNNSVSIQTSTHDSDSNRVEFRINKDLTTIQRVIDGRSTGCIIVGVCE